jgi:hypothetical protein
MAVAQTNECAMFADDCPRCGQVRTTFDIRANTYVGKFEGSWDRWECFLLCRKCYRPSIGLLQARNFSNDPPSKAGGEYVNTVFEMIEWVFEVPNRRRCPEHVPAEVQRIFDEAATCAAIGAWDAAGTMFRKVLDVATRSITPKPDSQDEPRPPNWKTYKDLRLRLDWLFDQNLLNHGLKDLSSCIHEDGNDAAHDAEGIRKAEAEDLADFTETVLETLFTVPGQIAENRRRRDQRRGVAVES